MIINKHQSTYKIRGKHKVKRKSKIPLPQFLLADELQSKTMTSVHALELHFNPKQRNTLQKSEQLHQNCSSYIKETIQDQNLHILPINNQKLTIKT